MNGKVSSLTPVPLPGECVYSIAAAFSGKWYRGRRIGAVTLFDGSAPASRDIPARLPQLAANLASGLRMDAVQVALRHTALPLHLPFLDHRRLSDLLKAVRSGLPMQHRLGTAPARLTCARALRMCLKCARVDRNRFGRAYWHREHQLPGVITCPCHGDILLITSVRPESHYGSTSFTTPECAQVEGHEILDRRTLRHASQLSRELDLLLNTDIPRPGPKRLHAYYLQLLRTAGYVQPNGSIAVGRLSTDLTSHYGHEFLQRLDCRSDAGCRWIAVLVRKPRNHQQPLRHVLLLNFLGQSVTGLDKAMAFTPHAQSNKPHPFRIRDLKRLAQLRPEKRRRWSQILSARKPREAQDLAIYGWLYRNDREWLHAHRHPRAPRKVDLACWIRRDETLAGKIPGLARRILRIRPTRRASRNAIASLSGQAAWLTRNHPCLPKATNAIKDAAEDTVAYAIRRIGLIANQSRSKRSQPVWKLRVQAGISLTVARRKPVAAALRTAARRF